MIIEKIELCNFRQFKGPQVVEFCQGERNVTVVYGENGRGKTGLFRALMFCLYGDMSLAQDEKSGNNILVNQPSMRADRGRPVTARVEVTFTDGGARYVLSREIVGLLTDSDKIDQQPGKVLLTTTDAEGRSLNVAEDDIPTKVARVLNKQVRDYFLFDGERIERLTRHGKAQIEDVRKGIRAILSLDEVEVALSALRKIKSRLDAEIAAKSSGALKRLELDKIAEEKKVEQFEADHRLNEEEQLRLEEQLASISAQLADVAQVSKFEAERCDRQLHLEKTESELGDTVKGMRRLINHAGILVAGNEVGSLSEHLQGQVRSGELPQSIKAELIDRLLEHGTCICGNCFGSESETARILKNYRDSLPKADSANLLEVWKSLALVCQRRESHLKETTLAFESFGRLREEQRRAEQAILGLGEEIKKLGGDTTKELSRTRDQLEQQQVEMKGLAWQIKDKLESSRDRIDQLEREIIKEEKLLVQADRDRQKRDLVARAITELDELGKRFTKRVRDALEERATAIFRDLADVGTSVSLDHIIIKDDYSLDVMSKYGNHVLADISAGQRQIVSLAFISALISVASGEEGTFEVPLFMDTPFGRLSGEHRDSLICKIPEMASQWILLSTDTEFTTDEAQCLQRTGRWGKLYVLDAVEPGVTRIRQENIGAFQPSRGKGVLAHANQ